jgi:signal transduction histidine kinase
VKAAARLLVLLLAIGLGIGGLVLQGQPPGQLAGVLTLADVEFVKSDAPDPPADSASWVKRALPDNWRKTNPGLSGYGWYRATFRLADAPKEPWAVYLPTVGTTYQLFLNGADVGTGGGMTGPITRGLGVPRLDPIAPQVLRSGDNQLLLHLRVGTTLRGGLGPITLGPRAAVEPLYNSDYFGRVTLTRSLNIALIFIGLLVLLLWLRRPQEKIYGCFAALAIVWSIRNFHYTVAPHGLPSNLWEAFVLGSLGVVIVLLWLFVLRFTGGARPRTERWLMRGAGASVVLFALLDLKAVSMLRIPWYLLCAAICAWSIGILLQFGRRPENRRHAGVWVILAAALITLALGLTDLAVSAQLLPFGPAARMAYGAPLLLCALVYALADGYFRTYDEVRALNSGLELRVAERAAELQRTHERVRALERATTLADERDRMMRDMHDGIGSQLMTTLDAVERGGCGPDDVAAMLRGCIDDLRLMIDSLEPDDQSLLMALANLRYRLEPRLAAAGIALEWQVRRDVALHAPGSVLQVLRIVQEALTNALRHAGATRLRFSAGVEAQWLVLELEDDGRGMEGAALREAAVGTAGRGLDNMRARAAHLGGTLTLASSASGTLLRLQVPLPGSAELL